MNAAPANIGILTPMRCPIRSLAAWIALASVCIATEFADPNTVSKAGATKVIVTIPVSGAPHTLKDVKTIPALLSRVDDLSADEKARILAAVDAGFVTAVRLESDSSGKSSWLEVPASGATVSRGESTFKFQPPKLEMTTTPRAPHESSEARRGK